MLDYNSHPSGKTPLALACQFGHFEVAKLLISKGADINKQDEEGFTALHVACKEGFEDCVDLLLQPQKYISDSSLIGADYELQEAVNGWTPLMLAAMEGKENCVKKLLEMKANLNSLDHSGWTAHEHAVFRGHMQMASMLKPTTLSLFSLPNQSTSSFKSTKSQTTSITKSFGHSYLQGQSMLIITLGIHGVHQSVRPLHFNEEFHVLNYPSLSLQVSCQNGTGDSVSFELPVKGILEPILFYTLKEAENNKNLIVKFDLISIIDSKKQLIGRASFVFPTFTAQNASLADASGKCSVPLVSAESLEVLGMLNFEYSIIHPFTHKNLSLGSKQTYWKSVCTKVIGHRGSGANRPFGTSNNLQIGENSVLSMVVAASLGAEYVEFDVQLTKDHVPVVYHDFILSETGLNIPVNAVTLEEFNRLGPQRKKKSKEKKEEKKKKQNALSDDEQQTKSFSLTNLEQSFEKETLKHHGGRGDISIKDPFATLKETFKQVPTNIGFNIEVKYPNLQESFEFGFWNCELNLFIDQILECVYEHAGSRSIIFSSFHPEACLMLNFKQPTYPVFFLTEAGTEHHYDPRCGSLLEAIRFAKFADLLGIVSVCDPLIEAPQLCQVIKENGLLLFSYGQKNNDVQNVDIQKKFGVDAVIVDKVLPISRSLNQNNNKG